MDFMKVIDQAVREIKREVNLKILKIPDIEQKVLDATDDEPWGPHGSDLAEIAQATNKFGECQMIMSVLWTRLEETGKNWRYVYKTLSVVEYLVAHGSERAVDEIIEHTYQIASLSSFEYVEPGGKDIGINVRTRAEKIVALLNSREKIQQVRDKAEANRNKYVGLSSTGGSFKSGSASYGVSSFQSRDSNGSKGGRYAETSNEMTRRGDEKGGYAQTGSRARADTEGNAWKKLPARVSRPSVLKSSSKAASTEKSSSILTHSSSIPSKKYNDDDDDDFDPRGTFSPKTVVGTSTQVEPSGPDLIDLMDAPTSVAAGNTTNDLFADTNFISASASVESSGGVHKQDPVDLFASGSTISTTAPNAVDFFAAPNAATEPPKEPTKPVPTKLADFDLFSAVPPKNVDGSHVPFGKFEFKSVSDSAQVSSPNSTSARGSSMTDMNGKPSPESQAPPKKETFQVKSSIWADSLIQGLIDLDISAPRKVSLADVGVAGDLSKGADEKKGHQASYYTGS